ncbi:MAG: hypothetical protein AAGJ69_05470, partial [Cyanobacteria bacterium J06559_1]
QWELSCSSLVDESHPSPKWQYQVQLQVFAPTEEDWSDEWPVPGSTTAHGITAHSTLVEVPEGEAPVQLPEDMPLVQAQAQLKAQLEDALGNTQPLATSADSTPEESAYRISLKQQAFLARRNQAMTIMGQVQTLTNDAPTFEGVSQLWLRLQNPETAQVIMEAHRPLGLGRLPADFKVKIQLPANVKTRVVLGEVSLRTASVDAHEPAKILSSTAFTITAGIAQLLDEIANRDLSQFEEEISELADSQAHALYQSGSDYAQENSQTEPDLVSPILNPTHKPVVPAVGVVLPPKLEHDGEYDAYAIDRPELPTFVNEHEAPLQVSDGRAYDSISDDRNEENLRDEESLVSDLASDALLDDAGAEATPIQSFREELPAEFANRPPVVTQPAQFMGTSIEDDDIEASQIAALLEDIDGNLESQTIEMDELEPTGVAAVLPEEDFPVDMHTADSPVEADPFTTTEEATEPLLPMTGRTSEVSERPTERPTGQQRVSQPLAQPSEESAPAEEFLTRAEIERRQRSQRQSEARTAFKSLKLKDHFWQRLSNLTHESRDEAAQLAKDMKAAGVNPRTRSTQGNQGLPLLSSTPVSAENLPANSEVVIYDRPSTVDVVASEIPLTTENPASMPERAAAIAPSPVQNALPSSVPNIAPNIAPNISTDAVGSPSTIAPQPLQPSRLGQQPEMTEDLPEMMLPVISMPTGDLIAGGTVTITVRSQPSAYKPFIKLWMIDRQSRTLVGEPKLLTNLQPDALGYLETSTELRVPMGCLDVQIAAIAVDMATQQESNKAIVNRHVVPAGQSSASLRSFNL